MKHQLVTVQTSTSQQELHIVKGLLKKHGIEAFTADENLDIIIGTPIAEGYKLQVDKRDEKKAREIMASTSDRTQSVSDGNYPKMLLYFITLVLLFGMAIYTYVSIGNFRAQYSNLISADRYSTAFIICVNLLFLICCVAIYFRKIWAWFFFNVILAFSLLKPIATDLRYYFDTYSLPAIAFGVTIISALLIFYNTKAVTDFFGIRKRGRVLLMSGAVTGLLVFTYVFFKPVADFKTLSSGYLGFRYDTAYLNYEKYTGQLVNYYTGGPIQIRGNYFNGLQHGLWEEFYDNGQVYTRYIYDNGKLDGEYVEYYDEGSVKASGTFVDGVKHGVFSEFFLTGAEAVLEVYNHGVRDGEYKTWTETGFSDTQGYYKNDLKIGVWKSWVDGNIFSEENFKNDVKEGLAKYYNVEGKLEEEGNFKNGVKEGLWKEFDHSGNVVSQKMYVDGNLAVK